MASETDSPARRDVFEHELRRRFLVPIHMMAIASNAILLATLVVVPEAFHRFLASLPLVGSLTVAQLGAQSYARLVAKRVVGIRTSWDEVSDAEADRIIVATLPSLAQRYYRAAAVGFAAFYWVLAIMWGLPELAGQVLVGTVLPFVNVAGMIAVGLASALMGNVTAYLVQHAASIFDSIVGGVIGTALLEVVRSRRRRPQEIPPDVDGKRQREDSPPSDPAQ